MIEFMKYYQRTSVSFIYVDISVVSLYNYYQNILSKGDYLYAA